MSDEYTTGVRQRRRHRAATFGSLFATPDERQKTFDEDDEYLTDDKTEMQIMLNEFKNMRAENRARDKRIYNLESQNEEMKRKFETAMKENSELKSEIMNLKQLLESERQLSSDTKKALDEMAKKYDSVLEQNKELAIKYKIPLQQVAETNGYKTKGKAWWKIAILFVLCAAGGALIGGVVGGVIGAQFAIGAVAGGISGAVIGGVAGGISGVVL